MALFTGHVVNKMDRKGRVSVPASFRNELVGLSFPGVVLFPSPEGIPAIDGAGIDWLQNLSANFGTSNPFAPSLRKTRMALFGQVERLAFDPEGRVILTDSQIQHAKISNSVAFIGMGETFQIWEPKAGEAFLNNAVLEASQEFEALKLSQSAEGE